MDTSDILSDWRAAMASISNNLKIKYGLGHDPSPDEIRRWIELVKQHIRDGLDNETAGTMAAKSVFKDFRTRHYASEADTIQMLLDEAGKK